MTRSKFNQKVIAILGLTALATVAVNTVVELSSNSASAVSDFIQSAQHQNGQTRSSEDFSTQGYLTTSIGNLPDGASVDIARDVSGGTYYAHRGVPNDKTTHYPKGSIPLFIHPIDISLLRLSIGNLPDGVSVDTARDVSGGTYYAHRGVPNDKTTHYPKGSIPLFIHPTETSLLR